MRALGDRRLQPPVLALAAGALLAAASVATAFAEATKIRFARQFSMGYLQFNVMERERLIEKHAKAAGLPDLPDS